MWKVVVVVVAVRGWWGTAVLLALVVAGCAHRVAAPRVERSGVYHEVRPGENLYRIGMAYGIAHQQLARVNGIENPSRLRVGQRIFIPGETRALPVSIITPERAIDDVPSEHELPQGRGVFIWPLARGVVTSSFGPRGQSFHDGIDIGAPAGTVVHCARDGKVIYSDSLRGYGNVVIIQHPGGYVTVYAHNDANLVSEGAQVQQGDAVGRVGRSGRTTGPNLHFEIRKDNVARNPVYFLPTETAQRGKDHST